LAAAGIGSMGSNLFVVNPVMGSDRGMKDVNRLSNSVFLAFAFVAVAACAPKSRQVLQEIDFSAASYPDSVAEVTGLSISESWGRWTDANVATTTKIRFKEPLPKQFTLVVKAQSLPGHESAKIRIGSFQQEFFIHSVGDVAKIYVDLTNQPDTIEIIPSLPVSPKELGLNSDARKLGVGLMKISIEN